MGSNAPDQQANTHNATTPNAPAAVEDQEDDLPF